MDVSGEKLSVVLSSTAPDESVLASLEELSTGPAELVMEAIASAVVSSVGFSKLVRSDDAVTDETSGVLVSPSTEVVSSVGEMLLVEG